ncbi:MAG TPA: hypothetical protein VGP74_00405 [Rubrobacteraceae bacterium]|nr:hypothetical protein [Rubrobacteraceae bacterium]
MVLEFAMSLGAIVVAASLFTDAVEILGGRLNLGQAAVGSVLAAAGSAGLPAGLVALVLAPSRPSCQRRSTPSSGCATARTRSLWAT